MSEDHVPAEPASEEAPSAKKAAKKATRKRVTKKAPRKNSVSAKEKDSEKSTADSPSLPVVALPGESLSALEKQEEPAPQPKQSASEDQGGAEEESMEKTLRKPVKGRTRDVRTENPEEESTENNSIGGDVEEASSQPQDGGRDKPGRNKRRERSDADEDSSERSEKGKGRSRRGRNRDRDSDDRQIKARPEVDFDQMSKKAWKIFESEVTEEGLALLDDRGLREYAKASLNAARIFLEEEARQKPSTAKD